MMVPIQPRRALTRLMLILLMLSSILAFSPGRVAVHGALTSHQPIIISGDQDFTQANGVAGGTGVSTDPYVIQGWDIDLSPYRDTGGIDAGISVLGTTSFFVIKNVNVHDGFSLTSQYTISGISLVVVRNGLVTNTLMKTDTFGIFIHGSSSTTITGNDLETNGVGIGISGSSGLVVNSNIIAHSVYQGLTSSDSTNNLYSRNISFDNQDGFDFLTGDSKNTLISNIAYDNGMMGFALDSSTSNLLYYNTAFDNYGDAGFRLSQSTGNILSYNLAYNNPSDNFYLALSNGNVLSFNTAYNSSLPLGLSTAIGGGFSLLSSNGNTLFSNTAYLNQGGFAIVESTQNRVTSNIVHDNGVGVFLGTSADHNLFSGNTVYGSVGDSGFEMDSSNNDVFTNNDVYGNTNGFLEYYANNQTMVGNRIFTNNVPNLLNSNAAFSLFESSDNTIESNLVFDNPTGFTTLPGLTGGNSKIENNIFGNTVNVNDLCCTEIWNSAKTPGTNIIGGGFLGGNFWNDYTGADIDHDGIGDVPYTNGILLGGDSAPLFPAFAATSPDFQFLANPSSMTVQDHSTSSQMVAVTSLDNFAGSVALSANVVPGVATASTIVPTISLTPSTLTLVANQTSIAGITVFGKAPAGTYVAKMTATSGSVTRFFLITITIPDFALSTTTSSIALQAGNFQLAPLNIAGLFGFNNPVFVSADVTPPGPVALVNPALNAIGSSSNPELNVTTTATVPAGNYNVNVTARNGLTAHSIIIPLTVIAPPPPPNISVNSNPATLTVAAGSSGSSTITVTSINSFAGAVKLSAGGSGASWTQFNPSTVQVQANGLATSGLTIVVPAGAVSGTYSIQIVATATGFSRSASISVQVQGTTVTGDFSMNAAPTSITVSLSGTGSTTINVAGASGFSGTVSLSLSAAAFPGASISPTTIALAPNGSGSSTLSLTAPSVISAGSYNVIVTGTSGPLRHTVTIPVKVTNPPSQDFSVAFTPSELDTTQNSSPTASLSLASINGFSGIVLISTVSSNGLTVMPSTASLTVAPGSPATLGMKVSTGSTSSGDYRVNVTARAGVITHVATLTVKIESPAGDFSITPAVLSTTITQGASGMDEITVSSTDGFAGTVQLSVYSPSGPTASLSTSASQLSASASTVTLTLTISVPASTPAYTYQVRITGISGVKTHMATVSVVVRAAKQPVIPQPEPSLLGLPVAEFYTVIGILVVVALGSSVVILRMRRKVRR